VQLGQQWPRANALHRGNAARAAKGRSVTNIAEPFVRATRMSQAVEGSHRRMPWRGYYLRRERTWRASRYSLVAAVGTGDWCPIGTNSPSPADTMSRDVPEASHRDAAQVGVQQRPDGAAT
jgi:hypothetical protein